MKIIIRTLVILFLVGAIFGGAAYFSYELYWKPKKLDAEDKVAKAEQGAPTPAPDYSLPAYDKAIKAKNAGDVEGARAALTEFIQAYPDSTKLTEAKTTLADINLGRIFSAGDAPGKTLYTVGKGDSLVKIASKLKTNAELIFRTNNMESIALQVGQQLYVPQLDTSLVVDRKAKTITLLNKGEFFKEYPALGVKAPAGTTALKVNDKIALQGSTRVAFGEKNYAGSERWLMLSPGSVVMRGQAEGAPPAGGITLSQPDMEEIFILVSKGTPVTIN